MRYGSETLAEGLLNRGSLLDGMLFVGRQHEGVTVELLSFMVFEF